MNGYKYTLAIPVRFRDLDAMGHVNNAVYLTYFEAARIPYYLMLSGTPDLAHTDMIVARIECDYRAPATFGDTLIVGVRVDEIRSRSFSLTYRIENAAISELVAEGRSVQVAYDYAARETRLVSAELIRAAEAYEGRALREATRVRHASTP
jgi:acyl-CoA thioester hydrolase